MIYDLKNIEVYNTLGEKILSQQLAANNQKQIAIDVTGLPSGTYFVKVKGENGEDVAKFVKQ